MGELREKEIPRIQMLDGGTGLNFEQLFDDLIAYYSISPIHEHKIFIFCYVLYSVTSSHGFL